MQASIYIDMDHSDRLVKLSQAKKQTRFRRNLDTPHPNLARGDQVTSEVSKLRLRLCTHVGVLSSPSTPPPPYLPYAHLALFPSPRIRV